MKQEVRDVVLPPRPQFDEDVKTITPLESPVRTSFLARNAYWASILYLIGATIAFFGGAYLAFQIRAWQIFTLVGIGALLVIVAVLSVFLIRRGRPYVGIRLIIGASLASVLITPILISGFGLILGLGIILVMLTMALQTLPQQEANWVLFISVGVAIVGGALDLLSLTTQLPLPTFQNLIVLLGSIMILISGTLMIRQVSFYSLTTKLILAFFAVSLIPLGLLAFWNDWNTRNELIEQARQSLFSAASKTAVDIDGFINNNLDTIHTEAQLPVLVTYLNLPIEQRSGTPEEAAVMATLKELSRKDKVFISSYALLDSQGQKCC